MNLKHLLILAPTLLSLLLLQSYFWVPSYQDQTKGNPERVNKFIEASIGDARILNPILNSDSVSSRITDLVFEGLLALDQDLNLRGRLARDWKIGEAAYLLVSEAARFPDGTAITAEALRQRITSAIGEGRLPQVEALVRSIDILPGARVDETLSIQDKDGKAMEIPVRLKVPERIKFTLHKVDQDFFRRLEPIIGPDYQRQVPLEHWIETPDASRREVVRKHYSKLLPVFEHNPEILFVLRPGVKFHDGHEVDTGDVKFTYDAIMDPKNISPRSSDFEPIKYIEVLGRYKVRVVYKRLFSPAVNAWTMGILPEHLLNHDVLQQEFEARGLSADARAKFGMRDSAFNRAPIGAGAFRFEQWQSDELIHLSRNPGYWEGPPEYKEFYYRVIPDSLIQEVEFRTGAIDTYAPLPHQVARYREDDDYQSFSSLSSGYAYIGYNNRRPLFSDKRVRRALGMAVNVNAIIEYVLYGEGEATSGPYPKNTKWYDTRVPPLDYDPNGAQKILADLGWEKGPDGWLQKDGKRFEFNLVTNQGNAIRKSIITIVQNSWRKIGVKVNTQLFEWAVFLQDFINPGAFDAVVMGWRMGADPDLFQIWHSSQAGANQLNFVGYSNSVADDLIVRLRREYDLNKQKSLAHQLHRVIAEDQPYTFLYAGLATRVLDKKIVMVTPDGGYSKIEPTPKGDLFYYFNRWRKLDFTPSL